MAMWAHFDNVSPCPIEASAIGVIELEDEVAIAQEVTIDFEKWDLAIPRRDAADPAIACSPEEWYLEEHTCLIPDDIPYAELIALGLIFMRQGAALRFGYTTARECYLTRY